MRVVRLFDEAEQQERRARRAVVREAAQRVAALGRRVNERRERLDPSKKAFVRWIVLMVVAYSLMVEQHVSPADWGFLALAVAVEL